MFWIEVLVEGIGEALLEGLFGKLSGNHSGYAVERKCYYACKCPECGNMMVLPHIMCEKFEYIHKPDERTRSEADDMADEALIVYANRCTAMHSFPLERDKKPSIGACADFLCPKCHAMLPTKRAEKRAKRVMSVLSILLLGLSATFAYLVLAGVRVDVRIGLAMPVCLILLMVSLALRDTISKRAVKKAEEKLGMPGNEEIWPLMCDPARVEEDSPDPRMQALVRVYGERTIADARALRESRLERTKLRSRVSLLASQGTKLFHDE